MDYKSILLKEALKRTIGKICLYQKKHILFSADYLTRHFLNLIEGSRSDPTRNQHCNS